MRKRWMLAALCVLAACGDRGGLALDGYDARAAYEMALLSNYAYEDDETQAAMLERRGYTDYLSLGVRKVTGVRGFVARKGDLVVVALQGTKGVRNDLVVAAPAVVEYSDAVEGKVHAGYKWSFNGIREPVESILDGLLAGGGRRVVLSGHSLGAGLAQLLALHLVLEREVDVAAVYLYGSTKIASKRFVEAYNARLGPVTYHHRTESDRVPSIYLGMHQTGVTMRVIDELGRVRVEPVGEAPGGKELFNDAIKQIRATWRREDSGASYDWGTMIAGDHAIALYQGLLAAALLADGAG